MSPIDQRLAELGIFLPQPAKPVANYVGWVKTGNLIYTAGQLPLHEGHMVHPGILGKDVDKEQAKAAARHAAINVVAQVRDACGGDLSKVQRVVKLTGFVASAPGVVDQPFVVNGASDLMVDIFGDTGRHARSAVGVTSLPLNACVEIEAIVEII